MRRITPHKRKPEYPTLIDWSNSINEGLVHFWPMWERGGTNVNDIVSGLDGVHDGSVPPDIIITEEGYVLSASASNGQINIANVPTYGGNYSCEFLFRKTGGAGYGTICANTGGIRGFWMNGGNLIFYDGSGDKAATAVSNDVWTHVVASFNPNAGTPVAEDLQFYVNGIAGGSATNINGDLTPDNFLRHNAEPLTGDIVFFKIYDGVTKSASEAKALYDNTWQAFKPRTQYLGVTVAAPTPTTIPVFMNHYRNQGIA